VNGHRGWTPLPNGARVRHSGHRWPEAFRNGTATIVRHFWRGHWLEYVVALDEEVRRVGAPTAEWSADATVSIDARGR